MRWSRPLFWFGVLALKGNDTYGFFSFVSFASLTGVLAAVPKAVHFSFFPQRAAAAILASSFRCFGVSLAIRFSPPFLPPAFPPFRPASRTFIWYTHPSTALGMLSIFLLACQERFWHNN